MAMSRAITGALAGRVRHLSKITRATAVDATVLQMPVPQRAMVRTRAITGALAGRVRHLSKITRATAVDVTVLQMRRHRGGRL